MAGQWASGARTGGAGPRAASNAEQRDSGARWKKEGGGRGAGGWARALSESVTRCCERAVGEASDARDQAASEREEERQAGRERAHAARLKRDCWAGGWAARPVRGSWLGQRAGPKREERKGLIGPGFLFSFLFSIPTSNKV